MKDQAQKGKRLQRTNSDLAILSKSWLFKKDLARFLKIQQFFTYFRKISNGNFIE